jgi:hypothetical protein
MTMTWEAIAPLTDRMWIPQGWIVRTTMVHNTGFVAVHMVVVPDPAHMWGQFTDAPLKANVPEPEGKH